MLLERQRKVRVPALHPESGIRRMLRSKMKNRDTHLALRYRSMSPKSFSNLHRRNPMADRLHKVLAQYGLGSRREIERWIVEGRIRINGELAQEGAQFTPGDRVFIDGNEVTTRLRASTEAPQVIIYHKTQRQPVDSGMERDSDYAGDEPLQKSVMESLPAKRGIRWLVINTMQSGDSGLLLLTTDGRLANALRRHATTIPAAYVARVLVPDPEFDVAGFPLEVRYDEVTITFAGIEPAGGEGANRWFRVEADHSHRRAAVRALFESRGLGVSRVSQVKFGEIELPRDLPRGRHRALGEEQVRKLYALAELDMPEVRVEQPRRTRPNQHKPNSLRRASPDHPPQRSHSGPAPQGGPGKVPGKVPEKFAGKAKGSPRGRATGNRRSGR